MDSTTTEKLIKLKMYYLHPNIVCKVLNSSAQAIRKQETPKCVNSFKNIITTRKLVKEGWARGSHKARIHWAWGERTSSEKTCPFLAGRLWATHFKSCGYKKKSKEKQANKRGDVANRHVQTEGKGGWKEWEEQHWYIHSATCQRASEWEAAVLHGELSAGLCAGQRGGTGKGSRGRGNRHTCSRFVLLESENAML